MKEKLCLLRKKISFEDVGKDCFLPVYNSDHEYIKKCSYKKPVLCNSKKARNPNHHKLIMAIGRCVSENLPDTHPLSMKSSYDIIKAIMLDNNIVDYKLNIDGSIRIEPKSISFESMDQDDFEEVSNAIIKTGSNVLNVPLDVFEKKYVEYL